MEKTNNNLRQEPEKIDITSIIDDLWRGFRRFWIVVLILIVGGAAALCGLSFVRYVPMYQSYATFVVSAQSVYGYSENYYNKTTAEQLNATFPYILQSGALRQVVQKDLGLDALPVTITATAMEETALFTINVSGKDPQMTYDVLQSVIENYPSVAEYIIGDTSLEMMDESDVPTTPYNEVNYPQQAAKGALGGAAIGFLFLLLYALTRSTVRREEDLKRIVSLTHLGSIPKMKIKSRSDAGRNGVLIGGTNSLDVFEESISGIRNRVTHALDKTEGKCIMVTSTSAGEGKTTIAVNLAISLAGKGKRVVLLDGDLHNPSVAKTVNVNVEGTTAGDLLSGSFDGHLDAQHYENTQLIMILGQKDEHLAKYRLREQDIRRTITALTSVCDYLIIDTPPAGILSDASVFARCADGIVFVVRQDYARIDRILRSVEMLTETGTKMLGYIVNQASSGITGYGYGGYGYGYGYGGYGRYGYGGYGYGHKHYGYGYGKKSYGYGGHYGYGYGEQEESSQEKTQHTHHHHHHRSSDSEEKS